MRARCSRACCVALGVLALLLVGAQDPPGASAPTRPSEDEPIEFDERELARILRLSPLGAAPLDATNRFDGDPRAETLGRFFFFDRELSKDGTVACATCHDPEQGFSDGKPVAQTIALGSRRTPSLWNVAWGRWFFHDGRADSLWSQALSPIEDPKEMGGARNAVAHRIAREPELKRAFEALRGPLPELANTSRFPERAFPAPLDAESEEARAWAAMSPRDRDEINRVFSDVGKMIAAYERRLVCLNSPFDRFVEGLREANAEKRAAMDPSAQRGLRLFLGKGDCRLCHAGPNFSDGEFHGLGLTENVGAAPSDPGRYEGVPRLLASEFHARGRYSDDPKGERAKQLEGLQVGPANWGEFKTPSLRNVTERAPYMHAGQFADLDQVLEFYSTLAGAAPLHQHQEQVLKARNFSDEEKQDLRHFLQSLRGTPPDSRWLSPPALDALRAAAADVPKEHKE